MARFVRETSNEFGKSVYTKGHNASDLGLEGELADEVLRVQAEIYAAAQRQNAGTMLNEEGFSKGYTKDSIVVGNPYTREGVRFIQVKFKGKRPDGKRAAEIAYYNEYGIGSKKGQRMSRRGFITKANEESETKALKAAEKVIADWTEKNLFFGG